MLQGHQEEVSNTSQQNWKTLIQPFYVAVHFHPGYLKPRKLINFNGFSALVYMVSLDKTGPLFLGFTNGSVN